MAPPTDRLVAILAFPGVQLLDVAGPLEVFDVTRRMAGAGYRAEVVGADGSPLRTSSGLELAPRRRLASLRGPIDTLVVAGGAGVASAENDTVLVRSIARAARRSRRIASVCNGAFLLAKAGLLDGRRATTHWAVCDELERRYPSIRVERDPIFVRDGSVFTSAGVTAGMDLALAMVEDDLGRRTALKVARALVMFVKRPGGQSQFSAHLSAQAAEREPLRELQEWILDHLDADLSVPVLAARACMSERNFARAFSREIGMTPASYVETVRVEQARIALESGEATLDAVARRCGFGTVETMRRAFHRRLRVGPSEYRRRFRPALETVDAA